jgi:GNAT superfamily N-acetyltransferase
MEKNRNRLEELSQFDCLEEFHTTIFNWLVERKFIFTRSELVGFRWLVLMADATPGVCYVKIEDILNAIHEEYNGNGISRATFRRMLNKAKQLGIVTVLETARTQNGSQDRNIYVFNRL